MNMNIQIGITSIFLGGVALGMVLASTLGNHPPLWQLLFLIGNGILATVAGMVTLHHEAKKL